MQPPVCCAVSSNENRKSGVKFLLSILLAGTVALATAAEDFSKGFIPGETARYKITWMRLPLAWTEISTDTVTENGTQLIRVRMISRSYKAYNHIYKVDNLTEVIIDPKTALPVRLDIKHDEDGRKKSQLTSFHHDRKIAIFQDRISKDIKVVSIKPDTMEVLSFLYASRIKDLKQLAGKTHTLFVEGKPYSLDLKLHDEDNVRLPDYGKVRCTEVEPVAEFDGLFLRKGKIFFWVSKENHRMVTCVKAKVAVGKITAKLQQVSGTGDPNWDRKK